MYTAIFDGGLNDRDGAYYSYLIFENRGLISFAERVKIEANTNNEAEYKALVECLKELASYSDYLTGKAVRILGDSRLVINQINGVWRITSKNLLPYFAEAKIYLGYLKKTDVKLFWWPGDQSKQFLGH